MRRYFLSLAILVYSFQVQGQTQLIDSLKKNIVTAPTQDKKLQALFAFCDQRQSLSTDTLCKYASLAKAISLAQNDISGIALAEYNIASCLVKKGSLDTALQVCLRTISRISKYKQNVHTLMRLTALKAQILVKSNKYKEALAEVYGLLHTAEQTQDTMMQMVAKNGIGWVNMEMGQGEEALKWFFSCLKTTDTREYHEKNSNTYSNIAAVYKEMGKYDLAEKYVKQSIAFSRKTQNLFYLANCLNILADIYITTKRASLAEAPLNEALTMREQIGDPFYIVSDMSELAIYYANISQPAKGIAISKKGIKMAEEYHLTSKLSYLYHALGENYKTGGNYLQYSKTLQQILDLTDSMYAANSAEARAEMDTRYNLQKKENLIQLQKLDISRKNYLIYGSAMLLLFTFLTSWLLLRGYKKTQQIRLLTMQAEERQLTARAVMSAEERERKRISRDLHDNIGAYATVLMANTEQLKKQAAGGDGIQQSAENVSSNAQNIMGSLQETIWVLNNDVITITDFIDRVKLYSKKMLQGFPDIQIRFREQLSTDAELSPAEALHLFRIVQEALQNALKHAKAKNILLTVESNETIFVSIKDDGTGFKKDEITRGNGLLNMEHRAKEAGYEFSITPSESGTLISFRKINHMQYCNPVVPDTSLQLNNAN